MGYMSGGLNVKEREGERDRQRDRQTDRRTDRQTDSARTTSPSNPRRHVLPQEIESADGGRPPTDERRESGAGLTGFTEKSGARSAARVPRYPQHGCLTRSENG